MKEEIRLLVNYRLERARESIEEAKILMERGHINTFINRLYYACFYKEFIIKIEMILREV